MARLRELQARWLEEKRLKEQKEEQEKHGNHPIDPARRK
jgi:hypothetical protein